MPVQASKCNTSMAQSFLKEVRELEQLLEDFALGSRASEVTTSSRITICDTRASVTKALDKLQHLSEITFDSEGVNLSRTGPLTLIQMSSTQYPVEEVFLLDVTALGGQRAFSTPSSDGRCTLKTILECPNVVKVTFDCRSDSDALYHQFRVTLANVLDVQVLCQAVSMKLGRTYHRAGQQPYVQGMQKRCQEFLDFSVCRQLGVGGYGGKGPHKSNPRVWGERPLTNEMQSYAANDCHCIPHLCARMREENLSANMMQRVMAGSQAYAHYFRDVPREYVFERDKMKFMLQRPI